MRKRTRHNYACQLEPGARKAAISGVRNPVAARQMRGVVSPARDVAELPAEIETIEIKYRSRYD
jgi:hypothetical protein